MQWNEERGVAAVEGGSRKDICYSGQMQQYLNVLSEQLLGHKMLEDYTARANTQVLCSCTFVMYKLLELYFHQCAVKTFALYPVYFYR